MSTPLELAKLQIAESEPDCDCCVCQISRALIDAEKDTERIQAWFGGKAQYDINVFMQGVREGWSVQVWCEFIDAAIEATR